MFLKVCILSALRNTHQFRGTGHLGKFSLSLHWFNLGNQPVEVLIEDVYLLVVPRKEDYGDLDELKRRMQDAKLERLQSAEVLHMQATGVEGYNIFLDKIVLISTALKVQKTAQATKALSRLSSQNSSTTFK
jgi:hypothetical protein